MARWVNVNEAAALWGVSVDTAKRRARNGTAMARKEQTASGFKWFVEVEDETTPPEAEPAPAGSTGVPEHLTELVSHLKEENDRLWQEVDARRREVRELHVLLQQAQSQIPIPAMAPAPQLTEAMDAVHEPLQPVESAMAAPSQVQPATVQPPWWAFWRRSKAVATDS
jgi:hypothetical protein